jgi:hypothetical protein
MMPPPQTQDLARRLLAYEAVPSNTSAPTESAAVRVCEKLRKPLCALAGVASYRSLLSRALTLARAESPSLSAVQVTADGSLQGLGELEPKIDQRPGQEGGAILLAHLFALFLTFIGADLTLRLLRDVWPDAAFDDRDSRSQRKA